MCVPKFEICQKFKFFIPKYMKIKIEFKVNFKLSHKIYIKNFLIK